MNHSDPAQMQVSESKLLDLKRNSQKSYLRKSMLGNEGRTYWRICDKKGEIVFEIDATNVAKNCNKLTCAGGKTSCFGICH